MNKRAFVACPFFFKQHVVINTVRILLIAPLLFLGCTSKPVTIKLLFTGDLMLDRGIRKAIAVNGVDYLFEGVKPLFMQQDYVIANFEGTVCDSELTASSKAFCFRAAPEWMPKLFENGITTVSLANNHSGDYGQVGLYQTAQYLHNNKIATMGYNETNDPCAAFIIEKNGVKLAIFSSSFLYDKDSSSICHESDDLLCNRIQSFKKEHTGYQIILCLHWGIEMKQSPEAKQVTQAHAFIDAGADLIMGHHPHVVQPVEIYKGKYIFYSMGNFIFDTDKSPSNKGILGCFSVSREQITLDQIVPFTISNSKPMLMDQKKAMLFVKSLNPSF